MADLVAHQRPALSGQDVPPRGTRLRARRRIFAASIGALLAVLGVVAVLGLVAIVSLGDASPAHAQYNPVPVRPKPPPSARDGQMMVQATEVNYDYNQQRVLAVGSVQLFFNGTSVEADKVIYDQKSKRLQAQGNVRMTDSTGKITYANEIDLSDDYRDGFVDSLRVDTPDSTRMAASRAERTGGNYTVYENGVYTACAPCRDNPTKPPLWQVKGARIIHNQEEKMLYFEDARVEFFGIPLAYIPFMSTPDPSVKRKTGFLMPHITTVDRVGTGFDAPFYWAIAPSYDATFSPRITTNQGLLMQAEFRQRFNSGFYQVRGYGIDQANPQSFLGTPGYRDLRGGVETQGRFAINDKWIWGWDGTLLSDRTFLQDYRLSRYKDTLSTFLNLPTEAVSQLYLTGVGNRSFFDARTIYYLSFSGLQSQVPIIHPVIDYNNVINQAVLGGEFSYKFNLTSLSRESAAFDPITKQANNFGLCSLASADPLARLPSQCLLRGIPGTYTRLTGEAQWRKSYTDSIGQIWTPFAIVRADAVQASISNQPGVSNFLPVGDTQALRVMPTVGLEYRYPFINVQPWGTTTIEPIAQVIVRPNESYAGKLPNEDAQSLVFDASNLFNVDKFSGYDRVEGGGRANVGVQATTQFNGGGYVNMLFGQSYQLFGMNSFAVSDITNTGVDSGLETRRSDYVARVNYAPNRTWSFGVRGRFDENTAEIKRFEAEGRVNFDRWSASMTYGSYAPQPELGLLVRREGILGSGTIKVASNWVVSGSARWDLIAEKINQYTVGAGYVDDCFVMGVNYIQSYTYTSSYTTPQLGHAFMFQIGLRTIAVSNTAATSQGLQ